MRWIFAIIGLAILSVIVTWPNRLNKVIEKNSQYIVSVYIEGEVLSPGWYDFEENISVDKLIEVAGGITSKANLCTIKNDVILGHKEFVYIGNHDETKVNINIADDKMLQTIKGIGPAMSNKIIGYREENGAFKNIYDLLEISGIGMKTFVRLRDFLCLE